MPLHTKRNGKKKPVAPTRKRLIRWVMNYAHQNPLTNAGKPRGRRARKQLAQSSEELRQQIIAETPQRQQAQQEYEAELRKIAHERSVPPPRAKYSWEWDS